jgi:hypothetical protein
MKKYIDLLRFKVGMRLAFPNKTITATERQLREEATNLRCVHCGSNPIE